MLRPTGGGVSSEKKTRTNSVVLIFTHNSNIQLGELREGGSKQETIA